MDVLVKCERLDNFGRGIGKVNGKIIFVSGLLPSEEALVKIIDDKKSYMNGEIISLNSKSKDRVCSNCPYDECGCVLKNLSYGRTLEYKKTKVQDILKRNGNINIDIKTIIPSDDIYGYRNKVTLKVLNGKLGYFKNKTNELIEIDKCLIASSNINKLIEVLKKEDLSQVSEIVIKDMDEIMVSIKGDLNIDNIKEYTDSIFINGKLVYGKEKITNSILGYKFLVSKDSFFQINNKVTENLYKKVIKLVGTGDTALDLYCGTGTISLLLSKNFKKVIGIEINKEAVLCANENKKLNGIDNVEFICGDANKLSKNLKADVIAVDPARRGLSKEGIQNILDIKPNKIVYVSCNPISLARDLKEFDDYKVEDVFLYDMFPWTYHVESVCLFTLKNN